MNGLAKLLTDLGESLDLQREYIANPEAVIARYKLSDAERQLLLSGDEEEIARGIGGGSGGQRVFKIIVKPPGG